MRLSVDDVRDLYATRRTLELAGLEAMVRRRPADDVWLQAAVQSMTEAAKAGDGRAAVAADAAFHLAIVASTSSRRLRTAAEAAMRELRIILAVADRVAGDLDDLAADHAGLLDALIHAPPPSARAALLDHLRRGESRALAVTHGASEVRRRTAGATWSAPSSRGLSGNLPRRQASGHTPRSRGRGRSSA